MEPATILLVDDEAVVRRVLGDALAQVGYRVELRANGQSAMERLRQPGIDLVVLDLQLGDTDGVLIMKEVRRIWLNLPIIILTAHGSLPSAIEAVRAGAADYLLKPVGIETLRSRVAEVLAEQRARLERDTRIRVAYRELQALLHDAHPADAVMGRTERLMAPASATVMPPAEQVYTVGPLFLDVQQHVVRMHGQLVDLTPTEFALLLELIRQPGVVVPCTQLVYAIQHILLDEDEARQMMRPHIVRLRRKIEPDAQSPIYIQSVRGVGYRWGTEEV